MDGLCQAAQFETGAGEPVQTRAGNQSTASDSHCGKIWLLLLQLLQKGMKSSRKPEIGFGRPVEYNRAADRAAGGTCHVTGSCGYA